jgi:hypothetical protein
MYTINVLDIISNFQIVDIWSLLTYKQYFTTDFYVRLNYRPTKFHSNSSLYKSMNLMPKYSYGRHLIILHSLETLFNKRWIIFQHLLP